MDDMRREQRIFDPKLMGRGQTVAKREYNQ